MSHDDKKRVALGTTLALSLGACSYWALGIGGGRNSDGLNSGSHGQKVTRVSSTDEPKNQKGTSPRIRHPHESKGGKIHRVRTTDSKRGKTTRLHGKPRVTIKKDKPKPAA